MKLDPTMYPYTVTMPDGTQLSGQVPFDGEPLASALADAPRIVAEHGLNPKYTTPALAQVWLDTYTEAIAPTLPEPRPPRKRIVRDEQGQIGSIEEHPADPPRRTTAGAIARAVLTRGLEDLVKDK